MNRNMLFRVVLGLAVIGVTQVVLESQANARFGGKLFSRSKCCTPVCCETETTCCQPTCCETTCCETKCCKKTRCRKFRSRRSDCCCCAGEAAPAEGEMAPPAPPAPPAPAEAPST